MRKRIVGNCKRAFRIKLGVLAENDHALQFWQRLGFEETERRPPRDFGTKSHVIILMQHVLEGK